MDFRKILIPVIGTEADENAIKLACMLAKKAKSKIWIVYVIALKRAIPLEAEIESEITEAEKVLDRMEHIAQEEKCPIETDLLQARDIGPAIVDEAVERDCDLILMGAAYKTRFGQFTLGEVVPYVLKNAACRVMLFRQTMAGESLP
jgi:nucleotide-binding universal stress UspA family protein